MSRIIGRIAPLLLVGSIIIIITVSICRFGFGQVSYKTYSNTLFYVACGIILIGVMACFGSHSSTGNFNYQYSRTTSKDDFRRRLKMDMDLIDSGFKFCFNAVVIGVFIIIFSFIIFRI